MNSQSPVKIKDVADHAGVSMMTVSLVLRGDAHSSRVSRETRDRVLDAAKQLRYQPNARGRALRTGATNVIGLFAGYGYVNVRLPFFTEVVSGLQEGCEEVKKDLLLHGVFHGTTAEDIYKELADGRIDGLVVTVSPEDLLAKRLAGSHLPVVAVADALPNVPSIIADENAGSRMLTRYLIDRGHRSLIYVTTPVKPVSALRRQRAFYESTRDSGVTVEEWCLPSETGGEEAVRALLARGLGRPTALVCWNDNMAVYLYSVCRRLSVRVPEELAIVGFDGCPVPFEDDRILTTVRAPWAEAARTAVLYLDRLLKGETVPPETVLPVEFLKGRTA